MMKRAGFVQISGRNALDEDGVPLEVIEVSIRGETFGIRIREIRRCLQGAATVKIERIRRNWATYLDGLAGFARLSRSGRAVNIELVSGERFTVARDSLTAVLARTMRYASVAEIPVAPPLSRNAYQDCLSGGQCLLPGLG